MFAANIIHGAESDVRGEPYPRVPRAAILRAVLKGVERDQTQEALAQQLGVSRARVANLARLRHLPPTVLGYVTSGKLSMRAGEELLRLHDLPSRLLELADRCVTQRKMTTLELRAQVDAVLGVQRVEPVYADGSVTETADSKRLAQRISEWLAAPVVVSHERSGRGELRIRYHSVDELEGILERIGYAEDK